MREIDDRAVVCPHCRANVMYQHHIVVESDRLIPPRGPLPVYGVAAVAGFASFFFGGALFGFMGGLVTAFVVGWLIVGLGYYFLTYDVKIICPQCGEEKRFALAKEINSGQEFNERCPSCDSALRIRVILAGAVTRADGAASANT